MASEFTTWGDYFIPGTQVLRNKLGIGNEADLREAEEKLTWVRTVDLDAHPMPGDFDYDHMKAIHRHLFQDVYEWAGEERVGPEEPQVMTKGDFSYAPVSFVDEHLEVQYRRLAEHDRFRDLPEDEFVDRLADAWGEVNFAHAFREGNTRTQILFFDQFCEQAGYELNREAFLPGTATRDQFVAARFRALDGNHDQLREFLDTVIERMPSAKEPSLDVALRSRRQRFPELFRDGADVGDQDRDLEL